MHILPKPKPLPTGAHRVQPDRFSRASRHRAVAAARTTVNHWLGSLLDRAVRIGARPFLRTLIGRWPSREELRDFRLAHAAGGHLSRPLHALSTVGSLRQALTAATLEAWLPHGVSGGTDGLTLTTRPRLAFMHLEKTAGTSVQEFLLQQYHPVQIVPPPIDGETANAELMRALPSRQRALLIGHYDLPFLQAWDPDRKVFTFLRDPRARILSLYYYWRSTLPGRDGRQPPRAVTAAASLSLHAFLTSDMTEIRNAIDNFYARRLLGWSVEDGRDALTQDPAAALLNSLAALDTLLFVGIAERLTDSLLLLASRLNMIPPVAAPAVNIGELNAQTLPGHFRAVLREPITPEIDVELTRLTRIDNVLYQAARTKFDVEWQLFDVARDAAERSLR